MRDPCTPRLLYEYQDFQRILLLHAGIVSSELRGTGYGEQLVFSLRVRLMFDKCSAYLRYITKLKDHALTTNPVSNPCFLLLLSISKPLLSCIPNFLIAIVAFSSCIIVQLVHDIHKHISWPSKQMHRRKCMSF
jgi:hypothetical protein